MVESTRPRRARCAFLAALSATVLLSSCGSKRLVVIALDEAFTAARPELARELRALSDPGYRWRSIPLRLSDEPGTVLAELDSARASGDAPVALIASPLLVSALPGPWRSPGTEASCLGDALLLAPEWRGASADGARGDNAGIPGFAAASTDAASAYAAAGSAAGHYIASLKAEGGSPACAILFLAGPTRPRADLEAFARAYGEASGEGPPLVRELTPSEDDEVQAEAAVRELLYADLRLLFVALGSGGPAAVRAAARPGLVIGGDFPSPEVPAGLAFRVRPDDRSLARALRDALAGALAGAKADPRIEAVPAILEAMHAAGDPARRAFAPFLRSAARRSGLR